MLTRNLALTVATAALLSASALPAMAVQPLLFDFTTTYDAYPGDPPPQIANSPQTVTGRFTTNDAGVLTGLTNFRINGAPAVFNSFSGSYTPPTGWNPGTTYGISSFSLSFTPAAGSGMPNPTVTYKLFNAPLPGVWLQTDLDTGGGSYKNFYQQATFTALPEIDGGVLPKALFVVAGAFLMFFGRNKNAEA